jgi:hypothetical protein
MPKADLTPPRDDQLYVHDTGTPVVVDGWVIGSRGKSSGPAGDPLALEERRRC